MRPVGGNLLDPEKSVHDQPLHAAASRRLQEAIAEARRGGPL
jgi:hypothetical protein